MSINALWQGWKSVMGDDAMYQLQDAFGTADYTDSVEYQRDMQRYQQNPTQYNANVVMEKWGDKAGWESKEDLASTLTYAEGTPQAMEHRLNEIALGKAEKEYSVFDEKIDLGMDMLRDKSYMSGIDAKHYEQGKLYGLEAQRLSNEYQSLVNEFKRTTDPMKRAMIEYELERIEETQDSLIQQIIAESNLTQDRAYVSRNNRDNLVAQSNFQTDMMEDNRDISNATTDYQIGNAKYNYLNNKLNYLRNQQEYDFLQGLGDDALGAALGITGGSGTGRPGEMPNLIPNPTDPTKPLTVNDLGQVVYFKTGIPYQDPYGNTYTRFEDDMQGGYRIKTSGTENVFTGTGLPLPKDEGEEESGEGILSSIFGFFSDVDAGTQPGTETTGQGDINFENDYGSRARAQGYRPDVSGNSAYTGNNTASVSQTVDDIVNQAKKNNISKEDMLEIVKENAKKIEQDYPGVNINAVLGQLNMRNF